MHLKMSSAKWRPFCVGLNMLNAFLEHVNAIPIDDLGCYNDVSRALQMVMMVTFKHDEIYNRYGLQSNFWDILQFHHSLPYEWRHIINFLTENLYMAFIPNSGLWSLLLTWFNFNPSMDK